MMKAIFIISYILHAGSFLFTCFILIRSFLHKVYTEFISCLLIYFLIGEAINSSSKFLSLNRNFCFYSDETRASCHLISNIGFIQIYLDILADMIVLISSLFISFTIYDSLLNSSKYFSQQCYKSLTYLCIIFVPIIISGTLGTVQLYYYSSLNDTDKNNFEKQGMCLMITCIMKETLNGSLIYFVFVMLIIVLGINVINFIYLQKKKKALEEENYVSDVIQCTVRVIDKTIIRVTIFPLVCIIMMTLSYLDKILRYFLSRELFSGTFYGQVFSIINSLRGILLTGLGVYVLLGNHSSFLNFKRVRFVTDADNKTLNDNFSEF